MPTPKKGPRLGGGPSHQKHLLANLATALFEHGRITTTETKARTLRPVAEKLITKAKKAHLGQNPLHQRREVLKTVHDKGVVHHLFTEIAPTFAERPGGYTRITKVGPRKGDNAPMAVIELVTEPYSATPRAERPATASTGSAGAGETSPPTDMAEESARAGSTEDVVGDEMAADETGADETGAEETGADETGAEGHVEQLDAETGEQLGERSAEDDRF